ncbi:MAG TPA: glycosyltransferase [Longimicrobium sp.]
MTPPMRLAVFTSHPIQYQAPLFRALAARPGLAPTVYFGSRHGLDAALDPDFGATFSWDVPLVDGYEHVFLPNRARRPDVSTFTGTRVPDVARMWKRGAYDAALVLGWQSFGHVQAMRAAHAAGIPLLLRGESHLGMADARPRLRSALWHPLRARIYRRVFARAAGMLTIGERNAEYYRHFGVAEGKLHRAPYCVENNRFALPAAERAASRSTLRSQLGIADDAVLFAAVGKLTGKKRPHDVLQAAARAGAHLVFVGDGPERAALEARAQALGVADRVRITGFVNQRALPGWYAAADALVLASEATETWGLVVNEAMAAGLPVLVSDAAGCAPDLVRGNGWIFPLGAVDELAARMSGFVALAPAERAAMGARSREIIADYTVERVAEVVENVTRSVA